MKNSNSFYACLLEEILNDVYQFHEGNIDLERFGHSEETKFSIRHSIKELIKKVIKWSRLGRYAVFTDKYKKPNVAQFDFDGLNWLYNTLDNEPSKVTLVKVIAYRLLGKERVKLPLNNESYWKQRRDTKMMQDKCTPPVKVDSMNWDLSLFNLSEKSFNIKLYCRPSGVQTIFGLKQYEYKEEGVEIRAEKGDYVIDAGGCWGDTALYFANEVGEIGMVYSFEFIPNNISVFKKNLSLNPHLKNRIKMIQRPLSDVSYNNYYFKDKGPGSKIDAKQFEGYDGIVTSISIDDFVEEYNLTRVDFIKMDIEGAEPIALKGAIETIKKFKPKLAIAIYHSMDDFANIPEYIYNLNLGYELYLGHYTIHNEETVLFAISDD